MKDESLPSHQRAAHEWVDCPAGSLDQIVTKAKRERRRRAIQKLSAIGAISCVAVVVYALAFTPGPSSSRYGNISCAEVKERIDDYRANRVSAELAARIATHLEECTACRQSLVRNPRPLPTTHHWAAVDVSPTQLAPVAVRLTPSEEARKKST